MIATTHYKNKKYLIINLALLVSKAELQNNSPKCIQKRTNFSNLKELNMMEMQATGFYDKLITKLNMHLSYDAKLTFL